MINSLFNVCWAECLKLRRSRATKMTAAAMAMIPVAAALLMLTGLDPVRARLYRLMTVDSQITLMHADWPRYFSILAASTAIGGLIIFSLFIIWIFGREHADRTSKELLTLPIPREMIVAGKILVAALWCGILQLEMTLIALALGTVLRLPLWTPESFQAGLARIFSVAALSFCLAIPFGFVANLSRGTMAAVGVLFMSIFFAIMMTAMGWGPYFPWSVPALYSGAAGIFAESMGCFSFSLVIVTGIAGLVGSMVWWRRADQR